MKKIDRTAFLKQAGWLGLAAMSGSILLTSCAEEKKKKKPEVKMKSKPAPKANTSTSDQTDAAQTDCSAYNKNLSEADLSTRKSLGYVEQSTKADQLCKNCSFWQPDKFDGPCGGCKLFTNGAVTPQGWCSTWVAIPS